MLRWTQISRKGHFDLSLKGADENKLQLVQENYLKLLPFQRSKLIFFLDLTEIKSKISKYDYDLSFKPLWSFVLLSKKLLKTMKIVDFDPSKNERVL